MLMIRRSEPPNPPTDVASPVSSCIRHTKPGAWIKYDKVIAAPGSQIPFLRKGSRDELRDATGATKLPALKLADGTVIAHSRAILSWIGQQT